MNPSQQQQPTAVMSKVRLMVSYGGQILPRSHSSNSLFYCGGDTRILAVDRRVTTNIAAFKSHVSSFLKINQPFVVKYQLPNHDLDSLISVTSDDDLFIMFDEHDRVPASSRLRLFLFPSSKQQNQKLHLQQLLVTEQASNNSPPDSWFSDTLKSAEIMRRKNACLEDKKSLQESVVLETSSSFGSTSSSGSSTNAPSVGASHVEEPVLKLPQPESVLSDADPASDISHTKIGIIQDPVVDVAMLTSGIASPRDELQSNLPRAYTPQAYAPVPFSGYPMHAQPLQPPLPLQQQQQYPHQQQMQFVQANSQFSYYPAGPLSFHSNSPMYSQLPPYQTHYRPSQGYPIYSVPISQTQPFNPSVQSNMIDTRIAATTAPIATGQPLMCSNVAMAPSQLSYNDVAVSQPATEIASKVYKANQVAKPVPVTSTQNQQQLGAIQLPMPLVTQSVAKPVPVTSTQNQQQLGAIQPPVPLVTQSVATPLVEATNKFSNVADDPAYDLIYKTQPSAPTMPSQFQTTVGPTTALVLPEDLTKLHVSEPSQQQLIV